MATKVLENDGAVVVTFISGGSDTEHVRMGPLAGGMFWAQFTDAAGDILQGSNDGTNWGTISTTTGANSIILVEVAPLFIRSPAANDGVIVCVGWQDR